MNKRILFIDVDGTIFSHRFKKVPESTLAIIKTIHQDVDLFLATGRSFASLRPVSEVLPYLKGFVLANGTHTMVNNINLRVVTLDINELKVLINACREIPLALLTTEHIYLNFHNEGTKMVLKDYFSTDLIALNGKPFDETLPYISAWIFAEKEVILKLSQQIPHLKFIPWGSYGGDVIPKNESKAQGIKEIIKKFAYHSQNTYAIGDGENDIEMFKIVNTSICIGGGHPKALQTATYITAPLEEDGFLKAIKHFKLDQPQED